MEAATLILGLRRRDTPPLSPAPALQPALRRETRARCLGCAWGSLEKTGLAFSPNRWPKSAAGRGLAASSRRAEDTCPRCRGPGQYLALVAWSVDGLTEELGFIPGFLGSYYMAALFFSFLTCRFKVELELRKRGPPAPVHLPPTSHTSPARLWW